MAHLHRKGIDVELQRLVFGNTQAVRDSRSPGLLVRGCAEIAKNWPPSLLVHGTSDKIVPTEQSEVFCRDLTAAGAKVHLILSEGEGHNDPVIHCPLMSDHNTVRAIIKSIHGWASGEGEVKPASSSDVSTSLAALPTWPRLPSAAQALVAHEADSCMPVLAIAWGKHIPR